MPATSVRDLIIKDDDIAVATHGRGFWILDNITPLRQLSLGKTETTLFKPATALRVRWNVNTDTPLPPDEPAGENPPDGAMIDYSIGADASGAVALEIKDAHGNVVRRYASTDPVPQVNPKDLKIPAYWVRPPQSLSSQPGLHRFLWDMHYTPVPGIDPEYPMTAVYRNTPRQATSPWAMPGEYSVVLTVNGKTYTQPLTLKMDPRVKASAAELTEQFELTKKLYELRPTLEPIAKNMERINDAIVKTKEQAGQKPVTQQLDALAKKLSELGPPNPRPGDSLTLDALDKLQKLFDALQEVDAGPRPAVKAAVDEVQRQSEFVTQRWRAIISEDVPAINHLLEAAGLETIKTGQVAP
jgi:hypothetical protein